MKEKDITLYKFSNLYLARRSWEYFRPHLWKVIVAMICGMGVSASSGGLAYLVKPTMDDIFISKDETMLLAVSFGFIGIMLGRGAVRFVQTYFMNTVKMFVGESLRNDSYSRVVYMPMRFFEESRIGLLMSRISGDPSGVGQIGPSLVMIFREMLTIIVLIGWILYLDWFLAFWAVIVLPLAVYPFFYFGKKLRAIGRELRGQAAVLSTLVQESLSGIRVVKIFGNEGLEANRFRAENREQIRISVRGVLVTELSSRVMELVGAVGGGLVIWYGGKQVVQGNLTAGELLSFLTSLVMVYDPVKKINAGWISLQQGMASAERVFDLLDSPDIVTEKGGDTPMSDTFESLEIKDLTYFYPGCKVPALDNVNLSVHAGQRVAIVGPSGAGKTTLVNLIPRFYDAQQGNIYINGISLPEYELRSLRLSIGVVSQDTFLFNITIAENIGYVEGNHSQEDIECAAKAAYAHDFIVELPQGYDTICGERGVKVSGGQKQRITIARALLKNPPLLILDEATSALDTESERVVQKALKNLMVSRTSIVIAHRLSTILSADKIVVMEAGRVVAEGKHTDLLESCPLYKKLYEMQFEDVE